MALSGRNTEKKSQEHPNYLLVGWLIFAVLVLISGVYVALKSYKEYTDPARVYGEWSIGAPSWSTERFILGPDGVKAENRYLSSSFEFDGAVVAFYSGDELYEYAVFGSDSERLKRVSGGGYMASFIKQGYEHTLPAQDNIGPARRVSLAEHFQSK